MASTVKVWSAGQLLTAVDVNNWLARLAVIKPADTSRNSTTTPASDPDLRLPMAASTTYLIQANIFYSGPSAGASDLKFNFFVPAGAAGQYSVARTNLSNQYTGSFPSLWTDVVTAQTAGVGVNMVLGPIDGIVINGANAGNLTFAWAQNTSNGVNNFIRAQSYIVATRIQ
jgi:hypothetical protein